MEKRILIRGARQLLTLFGPEAPRRGQSMRKLGLIPDGAVLIVNGVVRDVGPSRRVENLAAARDAVEVSADGRVVMPGFVDLSTHLVSGPPLLDEYEQRIEDGKECSPEAGMRNRRALVKAVRASSRSRLELLGRKLLREFVRHGTTTVEARSGLGLDDRSELKILRALGALRGRPLDVEPSFFGAAALPLSHEGKPVEYLRMLAGQVLPKVRKLGLARFVEARCGEGGFTSDHLQPYFAAARKMGFGVKLCSGEYSPDDGARLAVSLGAMSVSHLEHAASEDCALLANSDTIPVLLPGASFHRGRTRYAPARELVDAGAAVALGTGYSSDRSPSCSVPATLSLACNAMSLSPAEAVTAATINAAWALGIAQRTGSLEYGKDADLIMLNASDYREIPYRFGMNLIALTMKRGEVIYPRMEFPWSRS